MADVNDVKTESQDETPIVPQDVITNGHAKTNGDGTGEEEEDAGQEESVFNLKVILPHAPKEMTIMVSSQEQIHDIRQSIIEQPDTFQYSCFHLEHNGQRINDYVLLSEVKDLTPDSEIKLIEDPYTDKDARIHVIRVRELIGAAGNRTDTLQGILSGLSLHDSVNEVHNARESTSSLAGPMENYDFQAPGRLSTLLPSNQEAAPKTVKSISLSPWNPPPYHLRQKGHLLYLQLMTIEGESYQITAHVCGFYVNKSTTMKFDPTARTAPKPASAHSLLNLISNLSPSFQESFAKLLEFNNRQQPLAAFQITNATPASPWMVPSLTSPLMAHQSDITRTQESFLIAGIENTETLRDWNEEFQSTRELPKETAQDRVFRERLTSKLFADYTDAAARGAILVARGEVAPLNPTEARDAQIFVYNNVFFSFGADGVGTFASEGGDEAARVATGKDVAGVRMVNQFDIDGLFTPGTVVVDYLGKRIVGQSIVPGIFKQRDPGENQIDYGAVDGKEVVAADEKFVPVFEKLSKALKVKKHAVWDKDHKRHDLEGSVETKGLLGTDGRKYVLDLYRVTPLDIAWMEENDTALSSPEKVKDDTDYPHRMTVLRPELIDTYWKVKMREWVDVEVAKRRESKAAAEDGDKPAASTVVTESEEPAAKAEPEIKDTVMTNGDHVEAADASVETEAEAEAKPELDDKERIDISNFKWSLNPDAFSGQEAQTSEEKEEMAKDEEEVRITGQYLRKTILPDLIRDLKEGDVGFPMDGQSLSRLLHKKGVNIRYLGKLADLAEGERLKALRSLAIQDMIARAFKHTAGRYMRYLPVPLTTACIAHLLNCLLGADLNDAPAAEIESSLRSLYSDADFGFEKVTPETLRTEIKAQVFRRYRYTLEESWFKSVKEVQLLREVALKLGLQLELKEYRFSKDSPVAAATVPENVLQDASANVQAVGGKKKSKKSKTDSPAPATPSKKAGPPVTFSPDDIMNVVPIIKEASPKSSLAEEALEAGRISIMQGQKKLGQELLLESLSLHEQIYGILHPEVARVYNTLSMLYYQLDEKDAAVELARKSVIVSERTLGVDSAETLLSYLNLGLFLHANGESKFALTYVEHALQIWKIIYGPNHPDSITTLNNAAVMLQHLKAYSESRAWFEASLVICENVYGKSSINAATLLFQLAQALALDQDAKSAVGRMRESYNIFYKELGPEDKNTKEAESWLEQLTSNAVSIARHAKDVQARRLRGVRVPPRVALAQSLPTPQQATGNVEPAVPGGARIMNSDDRSINELLKFIEGAGSENKPKSKKKTGPANPKRRGGASKN